MVDSSITLENDNISTFRNSSVSTVIPPIHQNQKFTKLSKIAATNSQQSSRALMMNSLARLAPTPCSLVSLTNLSFSVRSWEEKNQALLLSPSPAKKKLGMCFLMSRSSLKM